MFSRGREGKKKTKFDLLAFPNLQGSIIIVTKNDLILAFLNKWNNENERCYIVSNTCESKQHE